jgi:hypothetical protein
MTMRRQMLLTGLGAIDLLVLPASRSRWRWAARCRSPARFERSLSLGEFRCWHVSPLLARDPGDGWAYGSYRLATASRELRDVAFAAALASAPVPLIGSLLGYQRIGMAFAVTLWAVSVAAAPSAPPRCARSVDWSAARGAICARSWSPARAPRHTAPPTT